MDAGRQIELAQRVDGLRGRIDDIDQRLCVRVSNCSRDFLSICGERFTVYLRIRVGSGIGPRTCAPVRLAVFTISPVD